MTPSIRTALATACLGVLAGSVQADDASVFLNSATGSWESATCEQFPQPDGSTLYMQRNVEIETERWALEVTTFADPDCSFALLDIGVAGDLLIEGASEVVEGAWDISFGHDDLWMAPRNEQSAGMLSGAQCGAAAWSIDERQDVSDNGCLFLPSVTACPAEYDLLALTGDELRFGLRMANLCDPANRPAQLEYAPLVRAAN